MITAIKRTSTTKRRVASTTLAGCVAGSVASAQSITNLGVLEGGTSSYANAVSADGAAVAGVSGSSAGDRAFRWDALGGLRSLDVLPGGSYSFGNAISADGSVLAGVSGSSAGDRAFRWTATGGMHSLGVLPGGWSSDATCISGDGSVAGGSSTSITGFGMPERAFRWTAAEGMQHLALFGTSISSSAQGVSADGRVLVGRADVFDSDYWLDAPCRWPDTGGIEQVGGITNGFATATSSDGSVVVGLMPNACCGLFHAFRWTAAGGVQELGALSATGSSVARAVSGDGRVVAGANGYTAFLWTSALGIVDLNAYLSSVGVNLTGWVLTDARGLNLDGSVIVGNGYFNGQARGWVATIPVPPTCYANCDRSTTTPTLNVNDFTCFLARFAAGDAYANCDGSATPPVRNVLDFVCFLNRFAAGCP